ncbi:hypothetical protein V502_09674 [Pseudogymnoascus sp. VKM F-4520 (FW-2644)]|nr:hypothetical protein V502_09674 [Pseudogymnoascus sp. VKM F-4520 (FW-2644)]
MKFSRCGIHGFHETLGIDVDEIRFYWALTTSDESAIQAAYRITVYLDQESIKLSPTPTIVWDSGKVESNRQRNVVCKPDGGFKSTSAYGWTVTVWDQNSTAYQSAPNSFFTAYPQSHQLPPWSMNQVYMPHSSLIFRSWFEDEANRWKGVWIGNGQDKPFYLRNSLSLPKTPSKAIMFASGLGHYNLRVNGAAASDHVLDPGWTNYHRTVQFVAYDLTGQLHQGENVLGAHVGNGFYAGDQGDRFFWPMYEDNTYVRYGNELCFFSELHLFYEDGEHAIHISDPNHWKVRSSATTLANIYASETHDARLYPWGWDSPGFDDTQWTPAKALTGPRGKLRYQSQPPVTLQETFTPKKIHTPRPGTVCFDLGQNASTMVKILVEGDEGSEITVRYAETVHEDGTVRMPDPIFIDFETKVYSTIYLRGNGQPEAWTPDFSFTSARYIQVDGVATESGQGFPVIHSVVGQHVSSASRKLGSMATDKDDVNALLNALYWTYASNLFSYHTDCPQMEKFAWLEVTHLLAPGTQYIRDMEDLYSKILDDILDAQEPDGLVPTMAPEMRYMCGPLHDTISWGCAICFLPDILLRYYDSTHVISKVYKPAVAYMEYMRNKERKGGLIEHGLGDWGRDIAFGNSQANIETAIYYRCLQCVESMAREQGLLDDAEHFKQWASRIREVYNQHLLVTDDTSRGYAYYTSLDNYPVRDCTSVNQAMALQFDLVPSSYRSHVSKAFLSDASDGRIRAGEIGLKYLWNTLDDVNRPDLVLQMARQEEHPSYMRFLRRGETTLLEFWQDECRSKCHDMLGTIYEWFYAAVLGIKPLGNAYRTFTLSPPYTAEFDHVEGLFDCPYGIISVVFDRKLDGRVVLRLEVPFGTTATLSLPRAATIIRNGGAVSELNEKTADLLHGLYNVDVVAPA